MSTYSDGQIPHGGFVISITVGVTPTSYILETAGVSKGSRFLVRNDENGEPTDQKGIPEVPTGSGQLQLATSTTKPPPLFSEFEADIDRDGTDETYVISEIGVQSSNGEETKVPITYRLKLNAS